MDGDGRAQFQCAGQGPAIQGHGAIAIAQLDRFFCRHRFYNDLLAQPAERGLLQRRHIVQANRRASHC